MTLYLNTPIPDGVEYLGCDLETTTLDPHTGKLLSISFSDGKDIWIYLHFHGLHQTIPILKNSEICKLFHNAKFDLKWIKKNLGIDVQNVYCTMLAEQVIDGGRGNPMSLDEVLARRLGIVMNKEVRTTFHDHPGFFKQPVTDEQLMYMAEDVLHLPALREHQLKDIVKDKLIRAVQIEFDALLGFADIELNGYRLNVDLWYSFIQQFEDYIQQATLNMRGLIGEEYVLSFSSKAAVPKIKNYTTDKINLGSPDQLKHLLKNRFKVNIANTNEKTLVKYVETHKPSEGTRFIEELLTLREWTKRKAWDYPKFINANTGKIHPDIRQLGTVTGRVSFADPNLQQVPRPEENKPNLRHCFLPDTDDYVLLRVDYGQQEPRVFAQIYKDPALLKACNEKDVYLEVAKTAYNEIIEKSDPRRQVIKSGFLGVLYRAGEWTTASSTRLPIEKAREFRNLINTSFEVAVSNATHTIHFAEIYGYVTTLVGSRRYFGKKSNIFTEAVNTPVQGTAAYMFKLAFHYVYDWIKEQKALGKVAPLTRVYHAVHDEIVVQVHKDEVDYIDPIIQQLMEKAGLELCPDVKHIAESKWSRTWDK